MATATDVKNRFGGFLEHGRSEPVIVEKNGRRAAVLMSYEEYERLRALEDALWGCKAQEAEARGYAGANDLAELLRSRTR